MRGIIALMLRAVSAVYYDARRAGRHARPPRDFDEVQQMRYIGDDRFIHEFGPDMAPVATLRPGERATVRTVDCYCNVLRRDGDPWLELRKHVPGPNPATGPIAIEGAQPGDTLAVSILDIRPDAQGAMNVRAGVGGLGDYVEGCETRVFGISDGAVDFGGLKLPIAPMIGVIGVATAQVNGAICTETPHMHGGNMDDRHITAGATVYLPVSQPGAQLALGDVHALMGDGEVAICGLECAAEVDICCELIKGRAEQWPVVRDAAGCYRVNCSADTLDEAARLARGALLEFLERRLDGMTRNHIAMLMSLVGDLEIAQIVDPLVTCRMGIRAGILPELKF